MRRCSIRYFYDCEFIEQGSQHPIQPISIGIVAEDGRELYMQANWFNPLDASDWLHENVFPFLSICKGTISHDVIVALTSRVIHENGKCNRPRCTWRNREEMQQEIIQFMDIAQYGKPELWAYYADYDHVVFCQLFGTMMDLPEGFPLYTRDIKQYCDSFKRDIRLPACEGHEHNALDDARHNKRMFAFLQEEW